MTERWLPIPGWRATTRSAIAVVFGACHGHSFDVTVSPTGYGVASCGLTASVPVATFSKSPWPPMANDMAGSCSYSWLKPFAHETA